MLSLLGTFQGNQRSRLLRCNFRQCTRQQFDQMGLYFDGHWMG